ncbi:DUF5590 domain-containing protein [Paenibacillus sp. FSL H8-0548]|uniref:cell wall elongation regulator TseB-like domain-containing protein n=1 Tax=Paenibacillus sp. FSL H8-0548 TaxID=1920422 RepID=UPI001180032F|nr:DUF5590 domain-containing protein [Paenibacillus sp. FSL H8-0548]
MTMQRWLFAVVASLILIFTGVFVYFRDIQQPQWLEAKEAKQQATQFADLASVEKVYRHIWNKESWIVQGSNQQDEEIYVWLSEDQSPVSSLAAEGVTKEQISDEFKKKKQDADIIRIQPGLFDDVRVWEVYYRDGDSSIHYYYDFYKFDNGAFIDSYKLPAKTEP